MPNGCQTDAKLILPQNTGFTRKTCSLWISYAPNYLATGITAAERFLRQTNAARLYLPTAMSRVLGTMFKIRRRVEGQKEEGQIIISFWLNEFNKFFKSN